MLDRLIERVTQLWALYPEYGARPVHLLSMAEDGDGLVTDVDVDCFDAEPVTSLLSSPLP